MEDFLQRINCFTLLIIKFEGGIFLGKRTKKNDAKQKNKRGIDSAVHDTEFAKEIGSAKANKIQKEEAKRRRADGWDIG